MIPPLTELVVSIPVETIFSQSLHIAADLAMPETAWQADSVVREVIYINSQIAANFSVVMQEGVAAGGFLTYASGGWLTLCAYEIFDTERIESTSATGKIGLTNSEATPYAFSPGDVRVLNETNGKTYTNQTGGTVPAFGSLLTTDFVADEPGTGSNLVETDTLSLVTTVTGIAPVFVENLIGANEETDPALKVRAREANAKASPNGPADAYNYYAKTTERPDGSAVGVTRTNKIEGNCTVTLYLADADGALTSLDRGYVFDNVNENVVPTGFTLIIPDPTCTELSVPVTLVLTPNPDSSTPQATTEANILAAIVAYYATIPIGGAKSQSFQGVYLSTLIQLIRNAAGEAVLNVTMPLPTADVPMLSGQIPVLDAGDFNVSWLS